MTSPGTAKGRTHTGPRNTQQQGGSPLRSPGGVQVNVRQCQHPARCGQCAVERQLRAGGPLYKQQLGARAVSGLRWPGRRRSGRWSGGCSCWSADPLGSTVLLERPPPTGCPCTCVPACLPPTSSLDKITDNWRQCCADTGTQRCFQQCVEAICTYQPAQSKMHAVKQVPPSSCVCAVPCWLRLLTLTAYQRLTPSSAPRDRRLRTQECSCGTASQLGFTVSAVRTNSAPNRLSLAGTLSNAWNTVSYLKIWQPCSGLARAPRPALVRYFVSAWAAEATTGHVEPTVRPDGSLNALALHHKNYWSSALTATPGATLSQGPQQS